MPSAFKSIESALTCSEELTAYEARADLAAASMTIERLKVQVKDLEDEYDIVYDRYCEASADLAAANKAIERLKVQVKDLEDEVAIADMDIHSVDCANRVHLATIARLTAKISDLETENLFLKLELDKDNA